MRTRPWRAKPTVSEFVERIRAGDDQAAAELVKGADAASGDGLHARRHQGRRRTMADRHQKANPDAYAAQSAARLQLHRRQRPLLDKDGHVATTMEWARKLSADDIKVLRGQAPYSEKVPNVDEGFTEADCRKAVANNPARARTARRRFGVRRAAAAAVIS